MLSRKGERMKLVLCTLLLCAVVLTTSKSLNNSCKTHCDGCGSFFLVTPDLACRVTPSRLDNLTEADTFETDHKLMYTKAIRGASIYIQCGKYLRRSFLKPKELGPRMLMFSLFERSNWQWVLKSEISSEYPVLKIGRLSAVTYVSDSRNLILCTKEKTIYSAPLDSDVVSVLRKHTPCTAVAADIKNKLVFICHFKLIYKMSPNGQNFSRLTSTHSKINSIALDSNRRLMFLCMEEKVLSIPYVGRPKTTVINNKKCHFIAYDQDHNALIYEKPNLWRKPDLMRMSMDSGKRTVVKPAPIAFSEAIYYMGNIYGIGNTGVYSCSLEDENECLGIGASMTHICLIIC